MTSEKQYIELYKAMRSVIDANSAPALNAHREEAAKVLERVGLARPKDFTHVDPEEVLAPDYALNLERHEVPTSREDLFTCGVPELSTDVHFLINEQYVSDSRRPATSGAWFAGSLRQFAVQHPEIVAQYYNRLAMNQEDNYDERANNTNVTAHRPLGEAALSTMLTQDGFVLYVPDGVQMEKPVQLISLMRSVDDLLASQRLLIIVGKDAKACLLACDHASLLNRIDENGNSTDEFPQQACLQVTEAFVGEGASLDFYSLEEHNLQVARLSSIYVEQQASSNVVLGGYALTAGKTRNRVYIDLKGEHAQTTLNGMVIADDRQMVDNITYIRHRVPDCQSNELYKYVLDDESRGSFIGRILVQEGAVQTDAHQTDRNLSLTDKTRMMARPELEIYADDVKCSHGATVGQLNQQAMYYMRTRGIPEAEARLLLMFAFMGDVIDGIRLEPLKDRLKHLVEKRFRGELSTQCKTCAAKQ